MIKKEKIKLENMRYFGLHSDPFYEGELVNGKPHGQGKLTFEKFDDKYESSFEGFFEDGIPIEGKFFDRFGAIYDGKFEKEDSERGKGKIIYRDGKEYIGEWDGLEKWGQGTLVFTNGTEFTGRWHEDCPSDGVMTYPDGTKYKGWFNQLSYDFGGGEIIYSDGSRFKSGFNLDGEDPKINFEGTMFYPNNGGVFEGTLHIEKVIKYKVLDYDAYELHPSKKDRFEPKKTIIKSI
ncbi:hypothetical protein OAJ95_01930 [Pelagibacteraceae bacterium]|nr:hypothetical protein [Pelagibacteraceae bacterium]